MTTQQPQAREERGARHEERRRCGRGLSAQLMVVAALVLPLFYATVCVVVKTKTRGEALGWAVVIVSAC
jgi:hypothetical protein